MKILLIQAWLGRKEELVVYPIGLACMATVLEAKGYDLKVFDANTSASPLEKTRRVVEVFSPDLIGISFRNLDNQIRIDPFYYYKGLQAQISVIHEAAKLVPIVIGGPAFSMFPELIMQRNPEIDFGVYLEAEESFPELVENLADPASVKGIYFRGDDGQPVFTGQRALPDLMSLPYPKRHFVDLAPYRQSTIESVGVQTKRGCPLTCAYCVYPYLNGSRWRLRRPEQVLEEIEYLRREFDVRKIAFADSIVNLPYSYSTKIFSLLKEAKLDVEWMGYMHVHGLTRDYLQLCLDSGCRSLIFSPDGLSRGALEGLKKNITPDDIKALKKILDTDPAFAQLRVEWTFFINPPGETLTGLLHVLWFFVRSKQFFRERTRNTFVNWIRLEPSSSVYRTALEQGVVTPETDLLPEDGRLLASTFYSNPRLSWLDPPIMAVLRLPKRIRRLVHAIKR